MIETRLLTYMMIDIHRQIDIHIYRQTDINTKA